jgi:two-component system invasion response regulator UvrY
MHTIRIALADDHVLIRKGLAELIGTFDNYSILFQVSNGQDFVDQIDLHNLPDIAMLDVHMPKKDGFQTAAWLQEHYPDVRILALSMYDEEWAIIRMLRNGARGYIFKDAEPKELKQALDSIVANGYHYSELITGHLIHNINQADSEKGARASTGFSERELEFFRYVCTELSYKEIGELMHLSARTVEGYREDLCARLKLRSRIGLVLYALKQGIVGLTDVKLKEEN